jgi:hypothetical protein
MLAIEQSPSEAVKDGGMRGGRERRFLDHAAPGDVARVDQIDIGENLPPHRRAKAVSANEHVSSDLRTPDRNRCANIAKLGAGFGIGHANRSVWAGFRNAS